MAEDNSTGVPLFGFPEKFFIIQYTGLAALSSTVIISTCVLIYILRPCKNFFSLTLADRLIVYLVFCDLFQASATTFNHGLMLALENHPPLPICVALAFFLSEFILIQSCMIQYAAFNAFMTVVLRKKLPTGKYDWRLLTFFIGLPTVIFIPAAIKEYFGPSGAWCFVQNHTHGGFAIGEFIRCFLIVTVSFIVACYSGVWLKIRMSTAANKSNKYSRTVGAMFLMVLAYLGQWWAAFVLGIWSSIQPPPFFMLVSNVFFSNLGGLCNFIAYVFIRKLYRKVGNSENEDNRKESGNTTKQ